MGRVNKTNDGILVFSWKKKKAILGETVGK
jgi:hypothetical protein